MNNENEIVTFVTSMGEIIGRLKSFEEGFYVVEDARIFVQTEQGAGFAPGISMTGGAESLVRINSQLFLTVVKANEQAAAAWRQQTSGIVT